MIPDPNTAGATEARFKAELAAATSEEAAYAALFRLSDHLVPVRLWTVMSVDMNAGLARRAFSNMPEAYPTSGTKPVVHNDWFEVVQVQRRSFVANTLAEIAAVFPDHQLIAELGCGSVLNLPVIHAGALVATVNMLDVEGHFTPARVRECHDVLKAPAMRAMLTAQELMP
ncbi:MAG: GAF domain-containing protein [Roseicyclus sp.]|nr:GAF domain-containing protein [Roseicyclus sp.]